MDVQTLRAPILNYELLVTRDPENVKAIFSTQSSDYDISRTRANPFMPLLGEGIFTSTGAQWRHSRGPVRPQFTHEEASNLGMIDVHIEIMLQMLKVGSDKWTEPVDLQPLFFYFTLDKATKLLYGQSVHPQTAVAGLQKSSLAINGAAFSHHFSRNYQSNIKLAQLRRFEYLQWVMNEVIRIVAIIPMNECVTICDTTLPRGGGDDGPRPIFVRKGVQILIPLYAI